MRVCYNKLWKLLIDRKMKRVAMRDAADISTVTLAKLGKDECVSTRILLRICEVLQCNIGDILDACGRTRRRKCEKKFDARTQGR